MTQIAKLQLRIEGVAPELLESIFSTTTPNPSDVAEVGEEFKVEYLNSAKAKDDGGLQIVNLLIHMPATVAAHFVAMWIHEKFSNSTRVLRDGVPIQIDEEKLKKLVQEILDALKRK